MILRVRESGSLETTVKELPVPVPCRCHCRWFSIQRVQRRRAWYLKWDGSSPASSCAAGIMTKPPSTREHELVEPQKS
jgi:hypothetical protein